MAVFAPIPRASDSTATAVKAGDFRKERNATRKSAARVSIKTLIERRAFGYKVHKIQTCERRSQVRIHLACYFRYHHVTRAARQPPIVYLTGFENSKTSRR